MLHLRRGRGFAFRWQSCRYACRCRNGDVVWEPAHAVVHLWGHRDAGGIWGQRIICVEDVGGSDGSGRSLDLLALMVEVTMHL